MSKRAPSPTAKEIGQTRPFRSVAQEAAVALMLTADRVGRSYAAVLDQHGQVTFQQFNVLRILRGAGERGLPTLQIAERMIETTPGITRLIDRLEEKGLVARERQEEDRRQVLCRITKAGLATLVELDGPINEADDRSLRELSTAELRQLIALLDRLRALYS